MPEPDDASEVGHQLHLRQHPHPLTPRTDNSIRRFNPFREPRLEQHGAHHGFWNGHGRPPTETEFRTTRSLPSNDLVEHRTSVRVR